MNAAASWPTPLAAKLPYRPAATGWRRRECVRIGATRFALNVVPLGGYVR